MTESTVCDPPGIDRDRDAIAIDVAVAVVPQDAAPLRIERTFRHEGRLLPNAVLDPRGRYGAACRARFDGRSLREAAEYVLECDADPGPTPDDFQGLLANHTGTIGAKQAFLAALALEIGRKDIQLIVGCCEMPLPEMAQPGGISMLRLPLTLPLAVCWLCYRGRRLQIVDPRQASLQSVKRVTEVAVRPDRLAAERVRLFQAFAADWCRALEVSPVEFSRLRAAQLRLSAHTSVFEDLLGHALPSDYVPAL
ncbi:MAG TPA: hypothetical protein VNR70_08965 [Steroidobacteraceae bacterium]|nr:hypothetical protein [Steroidobacteraceae bacterium]